MIGSENEDALQAGGIAYRGAGF